MSLDLLRASKAHQNNTTKPLQPWLGWKTATDFHANEETKHINRLQQEPLLFSSEDIKKTPNGQLKSNLAVIDLVQAV